MAPNLASAVPSSSETISTIRREKAPYSIRARTCAALAGGIEPRTSIHSPFGAATTDVALKPMLRVSRSTKARRASRSSLARAPAGYPVVQAARIAYLPVAAATLTVRLPAHSVASGTDRPSTRTLNSHPSGAKISPEAARAGSADAMLMANERINRPMRMFVSILAPTTVSQPVCASNAHSDEASRAPGRSF